ncbi:LysM peptidoglycan-binding domain-containing protein [Kitasatospora sp. RB6PN24]|uniref:LysM peptidoglycan-binding domain-containing protein n=1 Tax=Kitasatospora humi TaxID=2893891 RepID=UPI001E35D4D9|nr:LysM peptidoglycan-binding domain-containing protein [Kitasatospora humi]MCC9309963.1 LysM peptidoglycan-binding domain-containing protein [Kitasatospora humi]
MARSRIKAAGGARARTVTDVLGALLAGLLLLAILVGIPYGLVSFVGWPLPASMPTMDTLTQDVSVTTFIAIFACFVWVLWAQFAVCVAVELRSALRGVEVHIHVPAAGASQALARKLVTTMLLVGAGALTVGQAASAATPPAQGPAQQVAAVASVVPGSTGGTATTQASALGASSGKVYVVQASTAGHHETLWDIAQKHLGNGRRYSEIYDLNKGRLQPDGDRMTEAGLVRAGWQLLMPDDATGLDSGPAAPAASAQPGVTGQNGEHTVKVHQGDTLSAIAQRELGNGDRYPELLEATKNVVQPDGSHLTNADQLFPGDVIVIPAPAAATPAQPAAPNTPAPSVAAPSPGTQAPATPPAPAHPSPASPAPAAPATATPTPAASAPATEQPATTAPGHDIPAEQASAQPTATGSTAKASSEAPAVSMQEVGGIAALLGAGVLGVIARRRRQQQNERRPGETIAMPEDTAQAEQVLDRTSSPGSVDLLDRALRTLAHENPDALPIVRGARVTADRVEVLVEDPDAEALEPFTGRPDGWWSVRADRSTLLSTDEARQVPAPYPGLSTVGTSEDGTLLLANLSELGVLLLDGDEKSVREVARGIAMEAGTSLWADHIEVLTAGFGLELQQLLSAGRVMYSPSLATARADLARVLIEAHQAEHEGGEPPQPWIVVCASAPSSDELYEFADLLGKARDLKVAAVLPAAGSARGLFPTAAVVDASLVTESQRIDMLGVDIVLQRVTDEAYRQLTATMTTAAQPAEPATGAWTNVPDPDRPRRGPVSIDLTGAAMRTHLLLLPEPDHTEDEEAAVTDNSNIAQATGTESGTTDQVPAADTAQAAAAAPAVTKADSVPDPRAAMLNGPTSLTKHQSAVTVVRESDPAPEPGKLAPQVQVLGPLRIANVGDTTVPPKYVLLAALLIFKTERDYGSIANHMNPARPWSPGSMDQEMSRLRARLGVDSEGVPYLRPKPRGVQQYSLSDEVTVDWSDFLHLAERGLPHGPGGVRDLEAALALVRGRPFGGAGAHSWAAPIAQTMISRIVDTAHTIATLRCQDEVLDIDAARAAITSGLDVEPTAEILYRDWMRVEHRAGNTAAVRSVIDQVRQMATDWEFTHLQDETEMLITRLTAGRGAVQGL